MSQRTRPQRTTPQHTDALPRRRRPSEAAAARVVIATAVAAVVWLTSAGTAHAHPHHSHESLSGGASLGEGFLHPLLGWDHLLAMVAVGVLAALAPDRRVAWATPVAFVGAMLVGGAVGLGTGSVAPVEYLIVGSVIVLGVLIAATGLRHSWWLPAVAAVFGAAHGQAHGAEIPPGALPLGYVVGFVAATVALHATGAVAGRAVREADIARWVGGTAIALGGVALAAGA